MAATGLMLFGFVVVHMLGNLQFLFAEPEKINSYAKMLHDLGPPPACPAKSLQGLYA